jgi:hypothetical protein
MLNNPPEQARAASDEQVSKLEQALREERARADSAERLAASYLANVEDLRRALLMLEAGTGKPEQATEHAQSKVNDHSTPAPTTLAEQPVSQPDPSSLSPQLLDTTKGRLEPALGWSSLRRLWKR